MRCESGLDEQRSSTRTSFQGKSLERDCVGETTDLMLSCVRKIQIRPRCQPSKEITGNWSTLASRGPSSQLSVKCGGKVFDDAWASYFLACMSMETTSDHRCQSPRHWEQLKKLLDSGVSTLSKMLAKVALPLPTSTFVKTMGQPS